MLSELELQIADGVQKNGWYLVNYAPTPGSNDPDEVFTYTVGLNKSAGWPEIIVVGLQPNVAFKLLSDLLGACWEKKQRPVSGMTANGLVKNMPVKLVDFDRAEPRYFHFADWHARHSGLAKSPRLQLLWPDQNGVLPNDPACDPEIRALQNMANAE